LSSTPFAATMPPVDKALIDERDAFARALAEWYAVARRPLPWRLRPGLYETVVSELMAQQTQIATMLPYYERWMRRFPDFEALAAAPAEEVLRHWEGLGYYSRARNLHRCAQIFVHMAQKPRSAAGWEELPGIGPYTAAAIASIALGQPVAVVDGNVVRVLSRLTGERRHFSGNAEAVKAFRPLAAALLDSQNPGQHNQAMMELGALVCLRGRPLCAACPVAAFCNGRAAGDAGDLPHIARRATERLEVNRVLCIEGGAILLHRIPEGAKRLAGQFELPLAEELGWKPTGKALASRTRSITHFRIREQIHCLPRAPLPESGLPPELRWVRIEALDTLTLSGPHRRWIRELLAGVQASSIRPETEG